MNPGTVEKLIQASLQTSDVPLSIGQLQASSKDLEGSLIPAQELGYQDTLSYLRSASDFSTISYRNGQAYVSPIVQSETSHVREPIKGQRKNPAKKVAVNISPEVEEEVLFLLATLPDNCLLVQDLPVYYGSVYKKKLWYPKGKLPAWLSTAQRFAVTNSPKGRLLEVLSNVDTASFRMNAESCKRKLETSLPKSSPHVSAKPQPDPYGVSCFSKKPLGDSTQKTEFSEAQTGKTRTDDIPEDVRLLLQKILSQGSGGPVFASSLVNTFRLSAVKKSMGARELLAYIRRMPECQVTGVGSKTKVYLKPNWENIVQEQTIRKPYDPSPPSSKANSSGQSRSLASHNSVVLEDIVRRPSRLESSGHEAQAGTWDGQLSSEHSSANEQAVYESENDRRQSSNNLPSPTLTEVSVKDDNWPRQIHLNGRGRIKSWKAKCRLSATSLVKLALFLASRPKSPRSELIEQLRHIVDTSPTSVSTPDTLDAFIADLSRPGGVFVCDEQDRFSLRPGRPDGSSKLSWVPQVWQDALQTPSTPETLASETNERVTGLPAGFSLQGKVVALDGIGQYWFLRDRVQCDVSNEATEATRHSLAEIQSGQQYVYAEPVSSNGVYKPCYALALTSLGYEKYLIYLPELHQLRVVHGARLLPFSNPTSGSTSPAIPPLIYVKAMGRMPYHGQKLTIKIVSDLQNGAAMACLDTEECCMLLQVRDMTSEIHNSGTQPMVVPLVRWAGERLFKLEDAENAFGIERTRENLTVLSLDNLPWSKELKEHLQNETHLSVEPTFGNRQLYFVRLVDVILALDAKFRVLGGLPAMDNFLQELIVLL
ncbi:hypothetical protein BIW11_12743 [Tropilaelaps mercedesae]|uniref:HTH OST-type domain-containing protein n=1 Tax=Tropilaelaps mercedesae TaxID=418985 RepID=A0A1V9X5K6_9ACAR|nr:hypothetical protein BIW11_12743 [Tropilaelaps mercedesae]